MDPPTILVATFNRSKLEELRTLAEGFAWGGRSPRVLGLEALPPGTPVRETGTTFEENAILKARAYAARAAELPEGERPDWVVADDSGLSVDELGGAPGVFSARYAGEGATDAENNRKLLEALRGVPRERRGAEFVCAIACLRARRPGPVGADEGLPEIFVVRGSCRGEILETARGTGGFGYDPLFFSPEAGKTFAELGPEEKSRFSHRGRALRALRARLDEVCGPSGRRSGRVVG